MAAWNLNNKSAEYKLYGDITNELINMYGIEVTYLQTNMVGVDTVLGDIRNFSVTNPEQVYKVMMLPSTPEGFQGHDNILSSFGLMNLDAIDFFISVKSMDKLYKDHFNKCVGDIIILPSEKVMEITNIVSQVEGINNMFLYSNEKNVFKVTCKTYAHNHDEISLPTFDENNMKVEVDSETLDNLFNILDKNEEKQMQEEQSPLEKEYRKDPIFGDLL